MVNLREKMSQITHFCGVKSLAWKSGSVKFWWWFVWMNHDVLDSNGSLQRKLFRCACPYWCLLAPQSQQVSYSCTDNFYDPVHHIQSSLGFMPHIWFVSGQIWSSQGRRANYHLHGIKIMGWKSWNKKTNKDTRDQNMELIGKKGRSTKIIGSKSK